MVVVVWAVLTRAVQILRVHATIITNNSNGQCNLNNSISSHINNSPIINNIVFNLETMGRCRHRRKDIIIMRPISTLLTHIANDNGTKKRRPLLVAITQHYRWCGHRPQPPVAEVAWHVPNGKSEWANIKQKKSIASTPTQNLITTTGTTTTAKQLSAKQEHFFLISYSSCVSFVGFYYLLLFSYYLFFFYFSLQFSFTDIAHDSSPQKSDIRVCCIYVLLNMNILGNLSIILITRKKIRLWEYMTIKKIGLCRVIHWEIICKYRIFNFDLDTNIEQFKSQRRTVIIYKEQVSKLECATLTTCIAF